MKKQQQKSKPDRIKELIQRRHYADAIAMLQSLIKTSPTDGYRRLLARCQFEEGRYTDYFTTLQGITALTEEDLDLRQQAMDRLVGQHEAVSVDKVECLARLAADLLRCGALKESARMLAEALAAWLALYLADQAQAADFPAFAGLVFEPVLDGDAASALDETPLARARLLFCRAWCLRADASRPPERFDQALALLQQVEPDWPAPELHWEAAQIHQARRSWADCIRAYARCLALTPPGAPPRRLALPPEGLPDLSPEEAEQIQQAACGLIAPPAQAQAEPVGEQVDTGEQLTAGKSAATGETSALALIPVLEFCAQLLEKAPVRRPFYALMDALPGALRDHSPLLACLWVERSLEDGRSSLGDLERYLQAQVQRWPEQARLYYLLARVDYAQGEAVLAKGRMDQALERCPEDAAYQRFHQTLKRLELVSLRRPAERYGCLTEEEQRVLTTLFKTGKFTDLLFFADACQLPYEAAAETLNQFRAMKLLSPAPAESAEDRLPEGFVTVGDQVYRLQEDIAAQLIRQRESTVYFPVPPKKMRPSTQFIASIYRTGEEKRVYQALSRIFYTKDYPNQFLISVNIPMATLFEQSAVDLILQRKDLHYFHSTSVDFCVALKSSGLPLLAVEVDGITHYESKRRLDDRLKNSIFQKAGLPLLRICQARLDVFELSQEIRAMLAGYELLPEDIFASLGENDPGSP